MDREDPIAIVGAGSIGVGWAIAFSRGGVPVNLYDPDGERLLAARHEVEDRIERLDRAGLLDEPPAAPVERIEYRSALKAALEDVRFVQECAPEKIEVKRELFRAIGEFAPGHTIFASSTSAIAPTQLFRGLPVGDRSLVVHPTNPPYLLPVVELVRSEFTSDETIDSTADLMVEIGLSPIRVKEIEGFVVNRLQGAILREAYCLLRDGVASADEIDQAVRDGLGRRWAITGPFETADLNTRGGIASHAEKMGPAYERMGAERGQNDPWTPELVARVEAERREFLPLERWEERVDWRDDQLMKHESVRREERVE